MSTRIYLGELEELVLLMVALAEQRSLWGLHHGRIKKAGDKGNQCERCSRCAASA